MALYMPQSTKSYAFAMAQNERSQADQRGHVAMDDIIRAAMLNMFTAGYAKCLEDHNIEPPMDGQPETEGV